MNNTLNDSKHSEFFFHHLREFFSLGVACLSLMFGIISLHKVGKKSQTALTLPASRPRRVQVEFILKPQIFADSQCTKTPKAFRFFKGISCAVRIYQEWFITNGDVHAQNKKKLTMNVSNSPGNKKWTMQSPFQMFTSPDTTTALSAPRYIANQPIQTSSSILTLATHRPSMLLLSKEKFAAPLAFAHHLNKLKRRQNLH